MAAARPIWDAHFETIRNAGGPATNLADRAGANQTSTLAQLREGQMTPPAWETGHQVATGFGGYQPVNPRAYATEGTAQSLADTLGGTVRMSPRGDEGPFPKDPWRQIMLDGQAHNAGALGTMMQRYQKPYEQGLANYELNLRSNPSIIGTGALEEPLSQAERFRRGIADQGVESHASHSAHAAAVAAAGNAGNRAGGGGGWGDGGTGGGVGADIFPRSQEDRFRFLLPRDEQEEPGRRRTSPFDFFDRYGAGGAP
jgi:hypothetical protein